MSQILSQAISERMEKSIRTFVKEVAKKYKLKEEELYALWSVEHGKLETKEEGEDYSVERLLKSNKNELTALCKKKGVKCSGKKEELVQRLLGTEKKENKEGAKEGVTKVDKSSRKTPLRTEPKKVPPVIQKLKNNIPIMCVRRNAYGNYCNPETSMVFDKDTLMVIGKEDKNGKVQELTDADIQVCKKYNMKYELPSNMDGTADLARVKVEELEDAEPEVEEDDVVEDVEDEEVEELEQSDHEVEGSDEEVEEDE